MDFGSMICDLACGGAPAVVAAVVELGRCMISSVCRLFLGRTCILSGIVGRMLKCRRIQDSLFRATSNGCARALNLSSIIMV